MNVNSRLSIHSRRDKEFHLAKLTEWVSQKEVFFIKCKNQAKPFSKSSYLCVYQPKGDATYVTGCKPTIRSDDSKRFMLFRLIKLQEDEVTTCTSISSTAPFLIKFCQSGSKDVFLKVSEDCREVGTTEEKAKASIFYLQVHKCNYFKVLYKNASDQVYYLYAPAKSFASSPLSLSLREDARARSYIAFYYASHAPSHSRRLHQRELSGLLKSGKEDETELHITCQCSVDSDSRYVSDLYVKQKENCFYVKVKHGKTKHVEEKCDAGASFTRFVLLSQDSPSVDLRQQQGSDSNSAGKRSLSIDDSNQSQTSASKVSTSIESSQQAKGADTPSKADSNQQQGSDGKDSEIPSMECSKRTQHSPGNTMVSETPSTEDSKQKQCSLSTSMDSETALTKDLKQTQYSSGMHSETPSTISKDLKQTPHSSTDTDSEIPSTKDLKQTEQSTGTDSETPSTKSSKLTQHPTGIVSASTEDSKQSHHLAGTVSPSKECLKQQQHSLLSKESPSTEESKQMQGSAVDFKLEGMGQIDYHGNNFCTIM